MSSRFSSYSSYSSYPSYSRSTSTPSASSYLSRTGSDRSSYSTGASTNYYTGYLRRQAALPPRSTYTPSSSSYSGRSSPSRSSTSSSSTYKSSNYDTSEPRSSRYSFKPRDTSSSRDSGYGSSSSSYLSNRYPSSYDSGKDSSSSYRNRTDSITSVSNEDDVKSRVKDRVSSYDTPKDPDEERINERRKRLGLSPVRVSKSHSPIPPKYGASQRLENGEVSGCSGGSISSSYKSSYDSSVTPTIDALSTLRDMTLERRRTNSTSSETKEDKKCLGSPLLDRKPPTAATVVVRREKPSYSSYRRETTPDKEQETKKEKPSIKIDPEPESEPIRSRESAGSIRSRERRERIKERIAGRLASELDGVQTSSLPASSYKDSPSATGGFSENNGLVGLRNIGNTCFLNSVTQCLSNTPSLIEYLVKEGISSCDMNTTISTMKGELIKAFSSLLNELWRGNSSEVRCPINTSAFKTQLQRFAPQFIGYAQHDAQEFLRKLLEGLHEDVNRVTTRSKHILEDIDDSLDDRQKATEAWKRYLRIDDSRIVDMFVGQLMSCLKCSYCGYRSLTFDPFWDLSLPIPPQSRQVKIQQCLELFTKEEVLDGDEKPTCSKCKERRRMTKCFSIQRFPKVLVLHLKRFSPHERWRGKLTCNVDFPLDGLDLSTFASGVGSNGSGQYRLLGMANHSGTALSGHYTAYCKHPYKGQWYEYNDSRVSTIAAHKVCSPEAYLLFYELKY